MDVTKRQADLQRTPCLTTLTGALAMTQAPCPVCERPGWTVDLPGGGSVTLHSETTTPAGEPIINDACWTSE